MSHFTGKRDGISTDRRIYSRRPLNKPRGVAGRHDAKLAHFHSVRTRLQRCQELLMNVVEAAV